MIELIDRQEVIKIVNFECGRWHGLAKTIIKEIMQLTTYSEQISKGEAENENN